MLCTNFKRIPTESVKETSKNTKIKTNQVMVKKKKNNNKTMNQINGKCI